MINFPSNTVAGRMLLWGRAFTLFFLIILFTPFPAQAQLLTGYRTASVSTADSPTPRLTPPMQPLTPPQAFTSPDEIILKQPDELPAVTFNAPDDEDAPVDLQADTLEHDELTQTVIASGDVFLTQSGRILRADEIAYHIEEDKVVASGHVVVNEENGDIHYAESVELTDKMKNGFVDGLKTYLSDGSRFWARDGKREDGVTTTMYDATYTPCEPCKKNPERAPVWQIRASEVAHDSEAKRISYKNARFEAWGVPVAYTPYFAHSDGTIKRKSGFLSPSAGFKSTLGVFAESSYYFNIAPDKDATIGTIIATEENPLLFGEYRQRWANASLEMDGSVTYSQRTDSEAGVNVLQDEELRGHLFSEGLWDINDKWRSGLDVNWTSDDQFLRQYNFGGRSILESQLYAERFSGRNYAAGRLIAFQDLRVREQRTDQPEVLPEVVASFIGEPGAVSLIKGRWDLTGSFLGLRRDGGGQDVNRASVKAGWKRRLVSDYGLLTNVSAFARGDFYNVRDRDLAFAGSNLSGDSTETRFFPNLNIKSSYPMAKEYEYMQARIEPVVSLTLAENLDANDDIPNEDSQDVQIDASNLFEPNRFPGFDRVEDKSRVTYGMHAGLYGYEGSYGDVFLGQSYRLDDDDNPFPRGSGLDEQESDIVGQISGQYANLYNLDYRFQLDSQDMTAQRHEVDASADWDRFRISSRYLFAKALEGTDIDESREQLSAAASYYATDEWRLRAGAVQDLGENPGLRRGYAGLDYFGQCVFLSLTGVKSFTEASTGESDTEILFRIGLKNLGEFETSDLRTASTTAYSR